MKRTSLNQGHFSNFLERYKTLLEEVKVYVPDTLFEVEPVWEKLFEKKCPLCGNKLKFPVGKTIAYCKGKKHKRTFVIKNQTLAKILSTG